MVTPKHIHIPLMPGIICVTVKNTLLTTGHTMTGNTGVAYMQTGLQSCVLLLLLVRYKIDQNNKLKTGNAAVNTKTLKISHLRNYLLCLLFLLGLFLR